jgi:Protein of unknown function (DUF2721)
MAPDIAPITTQNPFAVLSLVAAPALLTNATSVLALSTVNRILRAGDRMRALALQLEATHTAGTKRTFLLEQVERVEQQALLQLRGLHAIYVALGCFASASLISLIGASLAQTALRIWFRGTVGLGLVAGMIGVGGLVWGCTNLLRSTRISIQNIREEARLIRQREGGRTPPLDIAPPS